MSLFEDRPFALLPPRPVSPPFARQHPIDVAQGSAKAAAQEIVEMARALSNNPDTIYQYVYNNVQTLPEYGSLKGPVGALMDGNGTAFDQAELMFQLLQQAGYSPSYQFGQIDLTAAQLSSWLGTDNSYNSVVMTLANGGFPATVNASGSTVTDATVGWAWVTVPINGTTYVFNPSVKNYTRATGLSNLASALGYTQSTFINHAESGMTTGFASLSNINKNNIRSDLTTMANNLVSYIKTNNPTAKTSNIIGGVTVQPIPSTTVLRQTSLSNAVGTPTTSSTMPSQYRTTITFGVNRLASDPNVWSGRASQEVSSNCRFCGLASMYPASDWSV
jgi:hypothetical protein